VEGRKQGSSVFKHLGIIFHGAGTERIEIGVHRKIAAGQVGEMPHQIELGNFSQPGAFLAQQRGRQSRSCRDI
jgi:hypothetical protein